LWSSKPGEYDDTRNLDLPAEVDHPDWSVDVEVVEHGAGLQRRVGDSVDSSSGVTVLPARTNMALHLTAVTDPRLLVVRYVLHCTTVRHVTCTDSATSSSQSINQSPSGGKRWSFYHKYVVESRF